MRLDAVSVGKPKEVKWNGKQIRTSIFKTPVSGQRSVFIQTLMVTDKQTLNFMEEKREQSVFLLLNIMICGNPN